MVHYQKIYYLSLKILSVGWCVCHRTAPNMHTLIRTSKYKVSLNMLLFGDFNSRTAKLADYIEGDKFIFDILGDLSREREETFRNFETADIPLERNSVDLNTKAYGYQLTNFCKNNSVFILNGRLDCHEPKLTCKNSSTVDYFVSSAFNFGLLSSLTTHEFDALFSDAHCPVSLTLIPINKHDQPKLREYRETEPNIRLWNAEKTESFCRNINDGEILK